jgi:hypothetical protein
VLLTRLDGGQVHLKGVVFPSAPKKEEFHSSYCELSFIEVINQGR